jgi:type IV pilus assembly protein PilA
MIPRGLRFAKEQASRKSRCDAAFRVVGRINRDGEDGFTLIELLVVMVIIGILAAVALPTFFNQKQKAIDARAKEVAHTVQVALETCSTENDGSYAECNEAALKVIEPTLNGAPKFTVEPVEGGKGYEITVEAPGTGHKFGIDRSREGAMTFPCSPEKQGACPSGGSWGRG